MSELQAKQLFDKLRAKVARADRSEPDGPDERDETITRLEQAIEAERDNAVELRKTIDEQQFRIQVLEQSYSKQLGDARTRAEKAEAALEAEKTRTSELESLRGTLAAELEKAQRDLKRMTDRERSSLSFDAVTGAQPQRQSMPPVGVDAADDGLSIDDMLAEENVVDPRDRAGARIVTNGPSAHEAPSDDSEDLEDMLSPDLVFGDKDRPDA